MIFFKPDPKIMPRVLATDLDGTLIPLPNSNENLLSLRELKKHLTESKTSLIFATGRHYESAQEAISTYDLPIPDWLICDVGSCILRNENGRFNKLVSYQNHLKNLCGGFNREVVEQLLREIVSIQLQAPDHQQDFKISYECESEAVDKAVGEISRLLKAKSLPFDCMGSIDPFLERGLIDVMPEGVSKASALVWLSQHADFKPDEVVYAGDSGNDLAALTFGFRSIIVGNHSVGLKDQVLQALEERDIRGRAFFANGTATSGVLEGCKFYELF